MNVREHVLAYLKNEPFVLCEPNLAADLARAGWKKISKEKGISKESYCIANCLGKETVNVLQSSSVIVAESILLEEPDFKHLNNFYEEHGLDPLTAAELKANHVLEKLKRALMILETVEPVYGSIRPLLRTIQVLRQDNAEIDTSYSHPNIPFSIFVSVCEDASQLSSLRVAESILHETMHLQLTLLERVIELIRPNTKKLYFSPWRNENRPARGILHGLYVFMAIHNFYVAFAKIEKHTEEIKEYLLHRIETIESELGSLSYFNDVPDLTQEGKSLVCQLFKYRATPLINQLP